MPRYLALQWNNDEAQLAVATLRGDRPLVEQAFTIALQPAGGESAGGASAVGEQIAAALRERGISRVETLVAIGRTNIELRQLTLPPAPDDELPDMVRMQATREFHALEDEWPLDYIPLEERVDQPRVVLAAAIDAALVQNIRQTCEAAGLKPQRLVLRPCATAALLNRQQPERAGQLRLLAEFFGDEAELTVVVDRKVIFLRTARLPGNPLSNAEAAEALLGELRRTMGAVQNQPGGRPVETIVLCGAGPAEETLCRSIQAALQVPAEMFDPFAGVELAAEVRRALPPAPARFAPLLGMLADELKQTPQAIDFFNPRRRPPPPNRRKLYYALGALAAVIVVGWFVVSWQARSSLQQEIATLTQQLKALEAPVARATKIEQAAGEVEKWATMDVIWLDELHGLCRAFSPAQDAMLTQLTAETTAMRGARIELQGLVRSAGAVDDLEQRLRIGGRDVEGEGRTLDGTKKGYSYRFKSTILLKSKDATKRTDKDATKRTEKSVPSRSDKQGEQP